MNKTIKRIWKDPVGSTVIAGIILTIILSSAATFIPSVRNGLSKILKSFEDNPFIITTLLLLVVVATLLSKIRKMPPKSIGSQETPVSWLSKLTMEQLAEYRFLFWFPMHHTLKTSKYSLGRETIDHIPEIKDLLDHGVLENTIESVVEYSISIDRECYSFVEKIFQGFSETEQSKQLFTVLNGADFIMLFRRQSLFR